MRTNEALQESREENSEKDTRAELLVKKIEDFLKNNRHRMERTRPPTGKMNQTEKDQQSKALVRAGSHADGVTSESRGQNLSSVSKSSLYSNNADVKSPTPDPSVEGHSSKRSSPKAEHEVEADNSMQADVVIDYETMKTFVTLHSLIDELLSLADACVKEKEILRVERLRLLEALRVKPGDSELVQMDVRLKDLLDQAQEALDETSAKIKQRDIQNKELEHKLRELCIESEKAIECKDEAISQSSKQLKDLQEKNRDLQFNCMKLEAETRSAKNELKQYKQKIASLERSRRLGYKPATDSRQVPGTRFPAIQS